MMEIRRSSSSISAPLAPTGKGAGGEGECRTPTACACLSASGELLRHSFGNRCGMYRPPHPPAPLPRWGEGSRGRLIFSHLWGPEVRGYGSISPEGRKHLPDIVRARPFRQLALALACLMLFVVSSGQVWQDKTSRKNAQGNDLYQKKNYTAALEKYVQAQDGKNHQQELSYNIANTLYQQKKYPEAAKELEKSVSASNTGLNQKVYFNRGNSFYEMGQYPQAIESYKKTLELDPKDRDAKYNLELALKKVQENPQKQKQNSSNKNQKKENNSSKEDQQSQNQQSDQQKQQDPQKQESKQEPQKQNANPKESDAQQDQAQKGEQKQGMDPKEALRILDAINSQEKREQRKQVLKIQREHVSGKDW
jgi:Ca-activated chloride channel family protein